MTSTSPLSTAAFSFSGHETFVLRSNWLKKAYDLLQQTPDLFFREEAFVRLGVGKNMAQSIRSHRAGRIAGAAARPRWCPHDQDTGSGRDAALSARGGAISSGRAGRSCDPGCESIEPSGRDRSAAPPGCRSAVAQWEGP